MKRCSQCDFIYEDDQNLCDMDGHELVYEPTLHGLQGNATTASQTRPTSEGNGQTSRTCGRPAMLVGTLLFVGYSGLTREYVPQTTKAPSTNVIRAPQSVPEPSPATPNVILPRQSVPDPGPVTPTASPTPSPSHSPRLEKTRARPATGSPLASSTPRFRSTAPGRETVKTRAREGES